MSNLTEQTLALAGVSQAVKLVQSIARNKILLDQPYQASINSLMVTDPNSVEQVYGCIENLKPGLSALQAQLSNDNSEKDIEITRYATAILAIERKLHRSHNSLQQLAKGISQVQRQLSHMDLFSSQVIANLADLYAEYISPLAPPIQVLGDPKTLQQSTNQNKVRALLLSGVRSAMLWRQLGGKRRHILWQRGKLFTQCTQLLGQN